MSIWQRRGQLEKNRRDEQEKLMAEYDATVHHPGMKQLREDCAAEGHSEATRSTSWHDNGFGWSWRYCTKCAARLDITGPDGATAPD